MGDKLLWVKRYPLCEEFRFLWDIDSDHICEPYDGIGI